MKINYEKFVQKNRELSTMGPEEKVVIMGQIKEAMQKRKLHGHVDIIYYEDAALVKLNGNYYNMFSYATGKFFEGSVGDYDQNSDK